MKNEKYCEEVIRTIEKWSFKTEKLGFTFSDVDVFATQIVHKLTNSSVYKESLLHILYFVNQVQLWDTTSLPPLAPHIKFPSLLFHFTRYFNSVRDFLIQTFLELSLKLIAETFPLHSNVKKPREHKMIILTSFY